MQKANKISKKDLVNTAAQDKEMQTHLSKNIMKLKFMKKKRQGEEEREEEKEEEVEVNQDEEGSVKSEEEEKEETAEEKRAFETEKAEWSMGAIWNRLREKETPCVEGLPVIKVKNCLGVESLCRKKYEK